MNIYATLEVLQNLTKCKITQTELGKILGKTRSDINAKAKRGTELKLSDLQKISEYYGVDITSIIDTKQRQEVAQDDNKYNEVFAEIPIKGEVNASCGYGVRVYNEQQTGTYKISRDLARDLGLSLPHCEMIFATGDSMYPTIQNGDFLLVDTSKVKVCDGKIYCVRINGEIFAKRLQLLPPQTVVVISDNEKYRSFEVDLSKEEAYDFAIIGEVRWSGRVFG